MGLPGKRLSRSSKRRRAAQFGIDKVGVTTCQKCKKMTLPHRACVHCGAYKGKATVAVATPHTHKEA